MKKVLCYLGLAACVAACVSSTVVVDYLYEFHLNDWWYPSAIIWSVMCGAVSFIGSGFMLYNILP